MGDFTRNIVYIINQYFQNSLLKTTKTINSGLRAGNYDSYKALFQRCYGKLLSFVNSIIKDKQAAEDIVQDQFLKLWDNKQNIDDSLSIESYLYVMTKNATINYIKSHSKFVIMPNNTPVVVSCMDLDRSIDVSIIKGRLMEIIDKMPEQRRKVFTMSKIDGMSNIEIAEKLGLSVKTVDRHLAMAKSYIKANITFNIS